MGKFYKKEVSQDRTPIVFRMDRRQTLDVNMEEMGDQNGMPGRTVSVSSLAPNIPRVKTRGISKSVSENELNKGGSFESLWNLSLQPENLAPVPIHNTHMKPMTVKSSAAKTSSCLCHFATMIVLSVCVVGFLASIAGVIYMEFFSSRNLTSLHSHTAEAQVDLSDVILSSPENHIDLMSNYRTFNFERVRKETIDDGVNSLYEKDKKNDHAAGKKIALGEQNIPNERIKSEDDTPAHEVNSTVHAGSAQPSSNSGSLEKKNPDNDENKTKKDTLERKSLETAAEEKVAQTLDESPLNSRILNERAKESDSVFPEADQKNKLEELNPKSQLEMSLSPDTKGVIEESDSELLNAFKNVDENKPVPYDISDLSIYESMNEGIQPLVSEDEISSTVQSVDDHPVAVSTEHDVDTMLMTVDDPEEELSDFVFNRKGEIEESVEFTSSSPSLSNTFTQSASGHSVTKKTVDLKVSLTEAMKYLQALDVNKKLVSSRSKPAKKISKPTVTTTKRPKQSTVSWRKMDNSVEKEKYLQKLRLMMYGHPQ